MKTPSKKLSLKKETLKNLNPDQLSGVGGGSLGGVYVAKWTDGCTTRPTSVALPGYPVYQYPSG